MKDRRPRKLKKRLKTRFKRNQAAKALSCALVSVNTNVQMASVVSYPFVSDPIKALKAVEIMEDAARAISEIMNQPPKNWREA